MTDLRQIRWVKVAGRFSAAAIRAWVARSGPVGAVMIAAAGLVAAVCLFLICFWVRLLFGPVYLGPSVGMVSGALADALPEGISLSYGQAALEWSREDDRVHLVVLDIRMQNAGGKSILSAPKAEVDLAGAQLLRGEAEVHRITLIGVKLTLVRTAAGKLRFGIGKNRIDQDIVDLFVRKLSTAKGGSSLKRLAIHRAKLVFYDEGADLYISSDKADLHLFRPTKGGNLQTALKAEIAVAGRPANVRFAADFPLDQAVSRGTLEIRGLDLAAFAVHPKAGLLAKNSHLPANVDASFTLRHGKLQALQLSLSGKGKIQVSALRQSLTIGKLGLSARYDGKSQSVVISKAFVDADGVRGTLSGRVQRHMHAVFPSKSTEPQQTPRPAGYDIGLSLKDLSLDLPHLFAGPVHFASVSVRADWNAMADRLDISRLHIGGSPLTMEASGALQFIQGKSPAVDLTGSLGTLNVRDFALYWPVIAAPGGRAWVDKNMPSGEVGPFSFGVHLRAGDYDLPALPKDSVDVRFLMENMEASYIAGMPHLTGIYGRGHLTGTDFTIDIDRASDGPMTMTTGKFRIPDINAASQVGDISFTLDGRMQDLMTLLDSPPLGYPKRFGISPNATGGMVSASAQLSVPLIHDVSVSRINIGVQAKTQNFSIRLAPQLDITGGDILFDVNNDRLKASGTAGLGGSADKLDISWREAFHPGKAARGEDGSKAALTTQISFSGMLDDSARDSLGVIPTGYIHGPMRVRGHMEGRRGAMADGAVSLSLAPAEVSFSPLNLHKGAGAPLNADVRLGFGKKSALSQVEVSLSGGKIGGHAVMGFKADGHLQQVDLTDFHDASRNRFNLSLLRRDGGDRVRLLGKSMDLSHLFDDPQTRPADANAKSGGDEDIPQRPLDLKVNLDKVWLRDKAAISGFTLGYRGVGKRIAAFSLDGSLGGGKLHGALKTDKSGRTLTLTSDNAGQLFRGFYGFDSMRGGSLSAVVHLPGTADAPLNAAGPDYTGTLDVQNFRIVDQPLLARLFTAGSLGGMLNLMGGKGIEVDRFQSHFSTRHKVISVTDTQAFGPSVGVTSEGYIDLGKSVVALKGTLVPMFGINSVLGNIPILGPVLTSKKGEGVFGFSYAISGPADKPSVRINPLSVLAPGFLRRIFEGQIPDASQAPSNQHKPAPVKKAAKENSGVMKANENSTTP